MTDKVKRVLSAAVLVPIILFITISGGLIFKIGITAIIAIALYEYTFAYRNTKFNVIWYILVLSLIADIPVIFFNKQILILPVIYLVVLLAMAVPIFNKRYNVLSSALTIAGCIYIVNFFTLMVFIRDMEYGIRLIWLVFIIAWFSDTFAYYTGRKFGKNKLCPDVSPKKTIEGSIGGMFGSIVGVILWGMFNQNIGFEWYSLVLLGIAGNIASVIGDLTASLIKRYVGIKDYGHIMPGHGGILDRFDSILFTVPIVYYYIALLVG